jgi:hypothetical protein
MTQRLQGVADYAAEALGLCGGFSKDFQCAWPSLNGISKAQEISSECHEDFVWPPIAVLGQKCLNK